MNKILLLFIILTSYLSSQNLIIINLNDETSSEYPFDQIKEIQFGESEIEITDILIKMPKNTLDVGDSIQAEFTVTPENAIVNTVEWISTDETIATVNENGMIYGIDEGDVVISVTINETIKSSTQLKIISETSVLIDKKNLKIYPNPTNDIINIDLSKSYQYEVYLTNVKSELVFTDFNPSQIDISNYSSGSYILTFLIEGNYYNYQIIKQ